MLFLLESTIVKECLFVYNELNQLSQANFKYKHIIIFRRDGFMHMKKALQETFGRDATFRKDQDTAIKKLLQKQRLLVVQKTGWGKSLVYFLTTKILRERGEGATLIISPLLSLTRNQIESTKRYGIVAECINGEENNTLQERESVINRCNVGKCDVIFITPEQIRNDDFVNLVSRLEIGLFVVDEAHCISDWGHDFRPDYRRINQLLQVLPRNISVLATTATANNRVMCDIVDQLGECEVIKGNLHRESLVLHKLYLPTSEEKYAWIVNNIQRIEGSGIIYATTIRECERLASWLRQNGINAEAYHGKRKGERIELERSLMNNEIKVLVSTIALGMGYDKKDISFIFHYYTPKSVIEYYQQIGRAGRAIEQALCVLLYGGKEEAKINEYFIYNSFPIQEDIDRVIDLLDQHNVMKKGEIIEAINIKQKTLNQILKLLDIEGVISKDKSGYSRTVKPYVIPVEYYNKIMNAKLREYHQLLEYQDTEECQMTFLTKALDDLDTQPCNKCSSCLKEQWDLTEDELTEADLIQVKRFFAEKHIEIIPRKRSVLTNRALKFVHEPGLVLAYYHEEVGQAASRDKYRNEYFSDILVRASKDKLRRFLKQGNYTMDDIVIIPIPSNRRPNLVPNFAERLANVLNCSYAHILAKKPGEKEQKEFLNSKYQEKNVKEHLVIKEDINLDNQQILLVDDFVDSQWTFTVAAELLGETYDNLTVIPFAIANTNG